MNFPVSWSEKYELKPGRWVFVQTQEAKLLGREIITTINNKWKAPDYYFHLRDGGHVKALKSHIGHHYFTALDLADFFGSMSRTRVTRSLKQYFDYETARAIAKASTVPHSRANEHSHSLPYGFSQSPLLASICLEKSTLGILLNQCQQDITIAVTVYMDDIILSSDSENVLSQWVNELKSAAIRSNLTLNSTKESPISKRIECFNITMSHNHLEITRDRFKDFYTVYNQSTSGHQRKGIGGYIGTVNKTQALLLDR